MCTLWEDSLIYFLVRQLSTLQNISYHTEISTYIEIDEVKSTII